MYKAVLIAQYTNLDNTNNRRYMIWFCQELLSLLDAVRKQLDDQPIAKHN